MKARCATTVQSLDEVKSSCLSFAWKGKRPNFLIFPSGLSNEVRAQLPVTDAVTWRAWMSRDEIDQILQRIPLLPDSAVVPLDVAAEHDSVSRRTVLRCYPTVQLSPNRKGVKVGYLRHRQMAAA